MDKRRRTALPLLIAAAVLCASGCAQDGDSDRPPISFGPCSPEEVAPESAAIPAERLKRLEFRCGSLSVPLDHADPGGKKIDIRVVRIRHDQQDDRIGSLVLNPGGPGQSGLSYAAFWASWISDEVLARFDVVTFDPRGTGGSAPINCGKRPDEEPGGFPDLLVAADYAEAKRRHQEGAGRCLARLGDRAPYFNTEATARDLDLLRAALGDKQLTYVGFSYGAKLGGEYAHHFPDQVRALVLDAPTDQKLDMIAAAEHQLAGFELAFDDYARGCAARPGCPPGGNPRAFAAKLVERANRTPIPSGRPGDDVPATGSDVLRAVTALLYDDATWPVLDDALTEAAAGDSGTVFEAVEQLTGDVSDDPEVANSDDAAYVINCNDAAPGPTDDQIKAAAARVTANDPLFGGWGASWFFGCQGWQPQRTVLEQPVAVDAPPLLVVGTMHDPATPYAGAVSFTETLGSGRLLTWEGEGHTAYGQSDCVNRAVDAYLLELTLPPEGTRCPS